MENSLIVKLNRTIAGHFPEGQVNYPETVRTLVALTISYQRMLRKLDSNAADMIDSEAVVLRSAEEVRMAADADQRGPKARHSALILPGRPR